MCEQNVIFFMLNLVVREATTTLWRATYFPWN